MFTVYPSPITFHCRLFFFFFFYNNVPPDSLHRGPHYVHILAALSTPDSPVHLSEADGTPNRRVVAAPKSMGENETLDRWWCNFHSVIRHMFESCQIGKHLRWLHFFSPSNNMGLLHGYCHLLQWTDFIVLIYYKSNLWDLFILKNRSKHCFIFLPFFSFMMDRQETHYPRLCWGELHVLINII